MKFFRLHTIRITVLMILASGLGPFLFSWQSAEAQSNEFTKWLAKLAKEDAREQANDKIRNLNDSEDLLREATNLISAHSEWFSLPIEGKSDLSDEEVYELIKKEWDRYQQGSTMSGEKAIDRQTRPGWTPEKPMSADHYTGKSTDLSLTFGTPFTLHITLQNHRSDSSPHLPAIVIRGP